MGFQEQTCISTYIVIFVPLAAFFVVITVGLIVRKLSISKQTSIIPSRHVQTKRNSQEPLIKEGEKPNGYDVFNATNNFLATVAVTVPPPPDQGPNYVVEVENLTNEIQTKEKEIERLSAEKEEFSVFLIRDLLASQKLAEELKKEVESLKRQLSESEARQSDTTPKQPRRAMETEEVLKLQQTVQELNAKIKTLEQQLRARSASPADISSTSLPPPLASPSRAKQVEMRPIPLSVPNSPNAALGIPLLEMHVAENAIESKRRELELSKELSNRDMQTPRSSTVSPRDSSALKWRMERGNKLDAFDKDGYLLIHRAVLEDRWDVVKHLMQIGADLNSLDARGETALHLAVRNDNELMVDYLLVYEADPNAAGGRDRSTPMHLCAYHGYIKCATALVKAGADLEAKTEEGYTPLRLAIDREQVDFALWLLEKNSVNVNCVDDLGETLLTYAVRINKESLIDFLLDGGAAADMVDDRNLSPCMVAARADNSEIIRMLISRGAGVDAKNSDGKTALHFAASSGSASAAQTLLELGADVDARDDLGNTPLHESCKNSKFNVSARLVANHATLSVQGGDGLTPLALAICNNDDDTVALLMSNGAS
eukprot:Phypoly_transcript_05204.p1 GENE.Phypoly_transcript_05204~~Phypoly_transcript_05204.p1  ORF type:complete len:600 (+),score=113.29 Phypoly_transcript_05204:149-1948(+)